MKKSVIQSIFLFSALLAGNLRMDAQTKIGGFKDDNGQWGYLNSNGEIVIQAIYSQINLFSFEGLALVKENKSKQFWYIDAGGNKIDLDCTPEKFGDFSDGRAMVRIGGLWGYIDTDGKLVIKAKYSKATNFSEGKAIVMVGESEVVLIDKSGNETDLGGLNITNFKDFSEGLARVQVSSGSWGFLNTEGKMAIEADYMKVGNFSGGLAWVRVGEKQIGFVDESNNMVIEPKYITVKAFDPVSGMARVRDASETWMYINDEGKELRVDAKKLGDFSEGYCSVDKNSKPGVFGFIDINGEWAIDPQYNATGDFRAGVCRIKQGKLWGLIDTEGTVLIEPKYLGLQDFVLVE